MAAGSLTSPTVWTLRAAQPEEREIVSDKRVVWHCGFPASHVTKLRIDSASQSQKDPITADRILAQEFKEPNVVGRKGLWQ